MRRDEVFEELRTYIAREVLEGRSMGLDAATPLLEWGIINSLETIRLLAFVRERWSVDVPRELVVPENLETLGSIADLVVSCRSGGEHSP